MPRSIFLGRVVGEGEPLWLDEDRHWALALAEIEADSCPDCHQPWGEATDKENEEGYQAHLVKCHACSMSAKSVRAYQSRNNSDTDGLHVHVERKRR
ncbi:hypothetical protein ABT076_10480 [Streptomyces sp. NPDC002131]|uniref:hypothetical protein n=1 Tax=Streptomyces sp. NPDC002131 TaxID=3154535 RepID=UPI0033187408